MWNRLSPEIHSKLTSMSLNMFNSLPSVDANWRHENNKLGFDTMLDPGVIQK